MSGSSSSHLPDLRLPELRLPSLRLPSPVTELVDDRLGDVRVLLKRDDLIHTEIPGNKWRKLKYNIEPAREVGTLLTFGGAYSNHLRATAAVGRYAGFATIGVVRGEERLPLNPSLAYAVAQGMRLTYLDRAAYREKTSAAVIEGLGREFGEFHLVPEGGSNTAAVCGCAELPAEIGEAFGDGFGEAFRERVGERSGERFRERSGERVSEGSGERVGEGFDVLYCAVGTGGTLAGIAAGLRPGQTAVGVPVLKASLEGDVVALQRAAYGERVGDWRLESGYHFGGYAKRTAALDAFIDDFEARHGLRLDWVYEAKMMYALFDQVGRFEAGTTVVALIN